MTKKTLRFKKILLVNLPGVEQAGYHPSPLGILYLAAYIRKHAKGADISIIDGAVEGEEKVIEKIKEINPDLIGISVLTPSRHEAIKISKIAKENNPTTKIILGGIHPSLMWEQMMLHYPVIDFIAKGEGEGIILDLILNKDLDEIDGLVFRNKDIITENPDRKLIKNLDTIPFPAWDLIDHLKYPAWGQGIVNGIDLSREIRYPIIFSRGCMGSCTFCSTWRIWKGYRFRNGKKVADEIEMLVKKFNAKHFVFQDDTLTGSKKEIIAFCKEIIKRKIKVAIFGTTRVDFVDEELLKLMKKAGFYKLSYGIESGSPEMLQKLNKNTNLDMILKAAKFTKKAKLELCALMMFGLPGETEVDRILSNKLLKDMQADEVGTIGEVWIFPGTALFQQAKAAKIMTDNFWLGKQPYYIYRGGLCKDPIQRKLLLKDWYKYNLKQTSVGKIYSFLRGYKN